MDCDIIISKLNESFARINCDRHTMFQLGEYFKFITPNHKFDPRVKAKMWDGYIRLLNSRDQTLPIGLIPNLVSKIETLTDYTYALDPKLFEDTVDDQAAKDIFAKMMTKLVVMDDEGHNRLVPDQHQVDAVVHTIKERRALLLSPTSSGKSLIMYLLARYFFGSKSCKKLLIVVPQIDLMTQIRQNFNSYGANDPSWGEESIHIIHEGQASNKPIVISTWQSIWENDAKWFEQFDAIFVDEAHTAKAKCLAAIMHKAKNARIRFGTTGTLDDDPLMENVLTGHFGPPVQFITTKEMMDIGFSAQMKIRCVQLNHPKEAKKELLAEFKRFPKQKYKSEIDFLCASASRTNFCANLAVSRTGNTLMLVNKVKDHGVPLQKAIQKRIEGTGKKVFIVHQKIKAEQRDLIKRLVEQEDGIIIIATYKIFSTGINLKNLHHIILASPSKSKIRILQSIGRGLRKHASKVYVTVYDLYDMFNAGKTGYYSFRHFKERLKIYINQEFQYSVSKVDLS